MKATQLSVFIGNKPGELAGVTHQLARFNINIKAVSVADGVDFGVIRMIVSDVDRAGAALREAGYAFVCTDVILAEIPDRPGALSALCGKVAATGANIRYIYATVTPGGGVAQAVLSTDNNDLAEEIIVS